MDITLKIPFHRALCKQLQEAFTVDKNFDNKVKPRAMILVTGANGFIGSVLAYELWKLGKISSSEELVLVDVVPKEQRPGLLRHLNEARFLHRLELADFLNSAAAREISAVFHMGANSSTTEKNWDHLLDVNVGDSQKIFSWCSERQIPLVYASSAATYGDGSKGYSDLTDPRELEALNLYGRSKNLFDQWALAQKQQPPYWYGVKFFNVYGPNEKYKGAMASLVYKSFHQIQKTGKIELFKSYREDFKDGEQKRDFVYVKDVARWMQELIETKPNSGLYNLGSGQARTWLDLARSVFKALGKEARIDFIDMPLELRDQYQYFTQAPMEKAWKAGLSAPQYSLEAGVWDYVRQHLLEADGIV